MKITYTAGLSNHRGSDGFGYIEKGEPNMEKWKRDKLEKSEKAVEEAERDFGKNSEQAARARWDLRDAEKCAQESKWDRLKRRRGDKEV